MPISVTVMSNCSASLVRQSVATLRRLPRPPVRAGMIDAFIC